MQEDPRWSIKRKPLSRWRERGGKWGSGTGQGGGGLLPCLGTAVGEQGHGARLTQQLWLLVGQDLVEDVVVPLSLELEDYPGFL